MSIITVATIKEDLRITQDDDDSLLQILLDAAEDEALQFLDMDQLPTITPTSEITSESQLVPSVYSAVFFLVRSKYDAADAVEIQGLRSCAETLLMPYREQLGI